MITYNPDRHRSALENGTLLAEGEWSDWLEVSFDVVPPVGDPIPVVVEQDQRADGPLYGGGATLVVGHGSFFAMLDQIIQHEPTSLFSTEQLGRLATMGIEKGKRFAPDARMQGIFDKAAQQGTAMSRAILYASR